MKNQEIRRKIRMHDLKYWEVAETAGISATTLSVWLRHELDAEKRERILSAICEIVEEKENET